MVVHLVEGSHDNDFVVFAVFVRGENKQVPHAMRYRVHVVKVAFRLRGCACR